jgi:hypothetical protein
MSNVVQFPQKPVCTNVWKTCTHDDCPLKALREKLGEMAYLGNCTGYVQRYFANDAVVKP